MALPAERGDRALGANAPSVGGLGSTAGGTLLGRRIASIGKGQRDGSSPGCVWPPPPLPDVVVGPAVAPSGISGGAGGGCSIEDSWDGSIGGRMAWPPTSGSGGRPSDPGYGHMSIPGMATRRLGFLEEPVLPPPVLPDRMDVGVCRPLAGADMGVEAPEARSGIGDAIGGTTSAL